VEQKTIQILEQQRQDLVIRVLKKHEEMEATRFFTDRILALAATLAIAATYYHPALWASQGAGD